MSNSLVELKLLVQMDPEVDDEALAETVEQFREELLALNVEHVDAPVGGDAPVGARGAELVALGILIVSLMQSPGVLTSLVSTVQSWVSRNNSRSVKLELDGDTLEVTGVSSEEQRKLIQLWIDRRSGEAKGK